MKKTFEVSLFNQKFQVKSDSDEKHIQRIADYVNQKIFEIREKTTSVSSLNVALLAALNISDDFFKMKEVEQTKKKLARNKISELVGKVDRVLGQG